MGNKTAQLLHYECKHSIHILYKPVYIIVITFHFSCVVYKSLYGYCQGFLLLWLCRCIYCLTLYTQFACVIIIINSRYLHTWCHILWTFLQLCVRIIDDCTFIIIYLLNILRDLFKFCWVLIYVYVWITKYSSKKYFHVRAGWYFGSGENKIVSVVTLFGCQRSTEVVYVPQQRAITVQNSSAYSQRNWRGWFTSHYIVNYFC